MEATMDDAIVEYLETYNQPQFAHSIKGALEAKGHDCAWIQADLDRLVQDGRIKTVEGGVDAGGNVQVCYAPLAFEQAEPKS
jgi:hypothetical protein